MIVNTIVPNKKTFNKAYVLFDDCLNAQKWLNVLIQMKIESTKFIWLINGKKYYGFKMFRIKRNFLDLYIRLEEVMNND